MPHPSVGEKTLVTKEAERPGRNLLEWAQQEGLRSWTRDSGSEANEEGQSS